MAANFESKKLIVEVKYTDANKKCRYYTSNKKNDVDTSVTGTYFLGKISIVNEFKDFLEIDDSSLFSKKKITASKNACIDYLKNIKKYLNEFNKKFIEFVDEKIENLNSISADNFEIFAKIRINDTRVFLSLPKELGDNKIFSSILYGTITNLIIEEANDSLIIYPKLRDNFYKIFIDDVMLSYDDLLDMLAKFHSKYSTDGYRIFGMLFGTCSEKNSINICTKKFINDAIKFDASIKESFTIEISKGCALSKYIVNVYPDNFRFDYVMIEQSQNLEEDIMKHNLYGIHITKPNTAMLNDYICIGWSELNDLSQISSKEDLEIRYSNVYPLDKKMTKAQNVGQIFRFVKEASIGDYVIYITKNNISIGTIVSDYYYDNNVYDDQYLDYVHKRKVNWLIKEFDRNKISKNFNSSLSTAMTFFKLNDYKSVIADIINGIFQIDNDDLIELEKFDFDNLNKSGINLIVYGTPGCGKSYYVKNELLPKYGSDLNGIPSIRTTFYQDYTNTDFVGQIMPVVKADGSVTYEFNPGPFTLALNLAIQNPDKPIALVIEELNRGNAASIFGDIFQLLDRENGLSVYNITNVNIQKYLENENPDYKFDYIKLPSNLSIICTMNTSDQNVFTLDTAFKRRWKFEKIKNSFETNHKFKNYFIPGMDVDWEDFCNSINQFILDSKDDITNSEDKQIGVYFVSKDGLRVDKSNLSNEDQRKEFAFKIFEYLWDDVAKYSHDSLFKDVKSLDELIDKYVSLGANDINGIQVFNDNIIKRTESKYQEKNK